MPGEAPVVNCQSAGKVIRLLERLVCGSPASDLARMPGIPAMNTSTNSFTSINAGYGSCDGPAAQPAKIRERLRQAVRIIILKTLVIAHPGTIDAVKKHVNYQSDSDQPKFWHHRQCSIYRYQRVLM